MTDQQYTRLKEARTTKKYGKLATWEELYYFQLSIATLEQIKQIGEWASKYIKNNKSVKLPLMLNGATKPAGS